MEDASAAAIIDARGILTGWSEGAQRLTGYPAREAVGRAARELLAEAVPPEAVSARPGDAAVIPYPPDSPSGPVTAHALTRSPTR